MEMILADEFLRDKKRLFDVDIDIDVGDKNDFELSIGRGQFTESVGYGDVIYIPGTEYGGIIGEIDTDTTLDVIKYYGRTWRGMLDKKIIRPPSGQNYRIISGELNTVLKNLIGENFSTIFSVSDENTGASVTSYQFERYTTLLSGIKKMLLSKGYRLQIKYVQQEKAAGYVQLAAVPIVDHSQTIELSQDDQLNFSFSDVRNGVNHLICLGKGELKDRTVIDLYVGKNGEIGKTQYYKGAAEVVEVYDNNNAEEDELEERGIEKLKEVANRTTFEMEVASLNIAVEIGDIVGGRDYLTGLYAKKPITGKVWRISDGKETLDYSIEGDDEDENSIQ